MIVFSKSYSRGKKSCDYGNLYVLADSLGLDETNGIDFAKNIGKTVSWKDSLSYDSKSVYNKRFKIYDDYDLPVSLDKRVFLVDGKIKYGNYSEKLFIIKELEWNDLLGDDSKIITTEFLEILRTANKSELESFKLANKISDFKDPSFNRTFYKTHYRVVEIYSRSRSKYLFKNKVLRGLAIQYFENNLDLKKIDSFNYLEMKNYLETVALAILMREHITQEDFSILVAPFESAFGRFKELEKVETWKP